MPSALDSLIGVLPVMVVGGVAMKMTEGMFPRQSVRTTHRGKRGLRRPARRSGVGFGNFRNVGF